MTNRAEGRAPFSVSLISNTEPGAKLCKVHSYDEASGRSIAKTNAFLTKGKVAGRDFDSMAEFMAFRGNLKKNQALMMGKPLYPEAHIVTQAALAKISTERRVARGIIARDGDHVAWHAGPALVMVDLDNPDGFPESLRQRLPNTPEAWRGVLLDCFPALAQVPMGWAPSSSSYLFLANREVHGLRGQRFYFPIRSGQDIPRFAHALHDALVLRGFVWYEVSTSGNLLKRLPFDLAVYRPEHLDFAAGPECSPPLEWRPLPPQIWNNDGPHLQGADMPSTRTEDRKRIDAMLSEARRVKEPEAQICRERWRVETGRRIADRSHQDVEQGERIAEAAVERGILLPEFLLRDDSGETVSVGELLEDPTKNDGRRFHDPLEPGYRNDSRIAVFLVGDNGKAMIFSHAHGGQSWRCERALPSVRVGLTHETVDDIKRGLTQDSCELFRSGDAVVWINEEDARIHTLDAEGLALRLQRRFRVTQLRRHGEVPTNLPARTMKALLSEAVTLPIPRLNAVVQGPFALADGTVVDGPGYNAQSEVMYIAASPSPPKIRRAVRMDQAIEALKYFWGPVHRFPLKTDLDRGVLLAAMFTALIRPSLQITPGYYITASTAGTGKTLLAQVVGALQTGQLVAASPFPRDEEERRKHLFASLREGAPFLLYDNTERGAVVDSAVIANLITSPLMEGRVLGVSTVERRPNRLTLVLTGNNLTLRGDLNRRILPITLDAGVERPWEREFSFHPVTFVLANWVPLRIAGLEVIQAWKDHGAPLAPGVSGFPEWDATVRSVVVWAAKELPIGIGFSDPLDSIRQSYLEDTETDQLGNLLEAWFEQFGQREVQLKDLDDAIRTTWDSEARLDEESNEFKTRRLLSEARHAILQALGSRGPDDQQRFGMYLRQHEGRIVRGLRLERCGLSGGARKYRVLQVNGIPGPRDSAATEGEIPIPSSKTTAAVSESVARGSEHMSASPALVEVGHL